MKWLAETYPRVHLAIYRSVSQLVGGRGRLLEELDAETQAKPASTAAMAEDTAKGDLNRSLGALGFLAGSELKWLEDELRLALKPGSIDASLKAISIVDGSSDRWARYGKPVVMDAVLLLPEYAKVVSVSSSEMPEALGEMKSAFIPFHLENMHYYPGFNRLKPVKSRRMSVVETPTTDEQKQVFSNLKQILRTVKHASMIGNSAALDGAVILNAFDLLGLWFVTAVIGRFSDVREMYAKPAGILPQVLMRLSDPTGSTDVVFHPAIFSVSRDDPLVSMHNPPKDLLALSKSAGLNLVILGWPLGGDRPYVLRWVPLANDPTTRSYQALARVAATRKVQISELEEKYPHYEIALQRDDVLVKNGWAHFVPLDLDPALFSMALEARLDRLDPRSALRQGYSLAEVTRFNQQLANFLLGFPRDRDLYTSEDPEAAFARAYQSAKARIEETKANGAPTTAARSLDAPESAAVGPDERFEGGLLFHRAEGRWLRVEQRFSEVVRGKNLRVKVYREFDPVKREILTVREEWAPGATPQQHRKKVVERDRVR